MKVKAPFRIEHEWWSHPAVTYVRHRFTVLLLRGKWGYCRMARWGADGGTVQVRRKKEGY